MKKNKSWIPILLSISIICIFAIDAYLLLSFEFPAKLIPEPYPSPNEELQKVKQQGQTAEEIPSNETEIPSDDMSDNSETEITKGPISTSPNIQTGQLPLSNVYVREIPIPLDQEMDDHLVQFRNKARMLVQEFPKSFQISLTQTKIETYEKTIALTFDDGPDSSATLKVVNILNKYGVPGTFFLIGQQMDSYPDIVNAILDGGHTIANHGWSHMRPTDISTDLLMSETDKTQEVIAGHNVSTKLYRPPYGLVKRTQMPALIEAGYQVVGWSIDSMDWYFNDPEQIVTCVVENAHPGAIVLMHSAGGSDSRKATIEALPIIIEILQKEGYSFVSIQ